MQLFRSGLFIICFFAGIQITLAQSNIVIKLEDEKTGNPIPFATVSFQNSKTKQIQNSVSDSNGIIQIVTEGEYLVSAQSLGYEPLVGVYNLSSTTTIQLKSLNYDLDKIVVTGQFKPQPIDKSIYEIKLVARKEIDLMAAQNLGEALKNQPGIQLQNNGTFGDFISIRGLSGEHIKLLVDGMPITGRVGGVIDLGQINMQNVDHIEIVEGPMSVVYGNNALAGVVNVITKTPEKNALGASLGSYYETAGTYNFDGQFSFSKEKHGASINIARNFFEGWNPTPTTRYQLFNPKLQYVGGLNYMYHCKRLSLNFKSDIIHEEIRNLDSIPKEVTSGIFNDSYYFSLRANNRFNLNYDINDDHGFSLQAAHSYFKRTLLNYSADLVNLNNNLSSGDTTTFHLYTLRSSFFNYLQSKFHYQSGFDLNYETAFGQRTGGLQNMGDYAAYMNVIYRPLTGLELQPGVRYIYHTKYKAPLVYSLNIKYSISTINIKASYGKGFRAPTLKELYLDFQDANHNISGNENLEAEVSDNINLTAHYKKNISTHGLDFKTSLYYNSIDNAIKLATDTTNPTWGKYFNIKGQDFITYGVDGVLIYSSPIGLRSSFGFSNVNSTILNKTNEYTTVNNFKLGLDYSYSKWGIRLGAYYNIFGENIRYDGYFDSEGNILGVEEQTIPAYQMFDVSFEKSLFKNQITASIGVKNLSDITILETSGGNSGVHTGGSGFAPVSYGRTFFVKLGLQFQ